MVGWVFAVSGLSLAVGVLLACLGLRGRRVNRDPVCRDCGSNLRALRLPEMHGVPLPQVAASVPQERQPLDANATQQPMPSDREDGGTPSIGEIPVTVTCPGCGGGLKRPKSVQIGERKRMPLAVLIGVVLVLLAAVPTGSSAFALLSSRDVSKHLPFSVLLLQSRFAAPANSRLIAIELERRILADELDAAQMHLVLDRTLDIQGDWSTPWQEEWGSVFDAILLKGTVNEAERRRWIRQSVKLSLVTRSQLRPGDPLPLRTQILETRTSPKQNSYAVVSLKSARLGSHNLMRGSGLFGLFSRKPLPRPIPLSVRGSRAGGEASISVVESLADLRVPRDLSPGKHEIRASVSLSGWDGSRNIKDDVATELRAEVEVVGASVEILTLIPQDEKIDAAIRKALELDDPVWRLIPHQIVSGGKFVLSEMQSNWYLDFGVYDPSRRLSVPIHMTVLAVDASGKEIDLGTMSSEVTLLEGPVGETPDFQWRMTRPRDIIEPPFTVVLRPDPEGAKGTFSLGAIYAGEIRVPVSRVRYSDQSGRMRSDDPAEIIKAVLRQQP